MNSFNLDPSATQSQVLPRIINLSQASRASQQSNRINISIKSQNEAKHEDQSSLNKEENLIDQEFQSVSSMVSADNKPEIKFEKEEDITMGMKSVNLNRYLLNGIVQLCRREELITEQVAHSFLTNHSIGIDKKYVQFYKSGKLQYFDFQKCKINLIDHRRLTKMLVDHNPQKYIPITKPQTPYDFVKETQEFLKDLYQLDQEAYQNELRNQVQKHCQTWWGGPEKILTVADPPVKFYETQDGQKARIERQTAIVVETIQQQRQRNKRLHTQRTVNQDLKDIAKSLSLRLYGQKIKIQNGSDTQNQQNSSMADSNSEKMNRNERRKKKRAKQSKEKKQKKDKKEKKVKKDKSKKKDKKNKKDKRSKSKNDPVDPKMEPDSPQPDPDNNPETKPALKK